MRVKFKNSEWLRVQQTADLLAVSATTVRRWADSGLVASWRTPSGQRRFSRADLEARANGLAIPGPLPRSDDEKRLRLLLDTSFELASTLDLDEVLESAARRLSAALDIPDCDIYELRGDRRMVCLASTLDGVYDSSWVGSEIGCDDYPCDWLAMETRQPIAMTSRDDPRLGEVEREAMCRFGQVSSITLPLIARDKIIGTVQLFDHVERAFTQADIATAESVTKLVAMAIEHAQLYDEVKRLHLGNLRALSSALSAKDYYTLGHAGSVAAYTAMLGRELGWPDERLDELQNVAFLHDIGKIGVSDRVLLKAGPLTSEEWELMRQHPGISAEIVRPLFDEELVAGVRHHHERFDGKGYPDGLSGADIPLVARLMCVVDCYDAMSCERPYRRALTYRQCLAELRRCAGTQFDPDMVAAFLRALGRLRRRRNRVDTLAAQASALIDPAAHALLRSRADEESPHYQAMVAELRRFRESHPPIRFVTTFVTDGDHCMTVLDTGQTETEVSHIGDQWLAQDELAAVLAGERAKANVRIARIVESCSRRVDLAARYGGEEFVLVLVDTDHTGACTVAERIRTEVAAAASTLGGRPLSVSVGVATFPDDAGAKDELLDKADWAMYAAKRAGRDRVLSFRDGLVAKETWLSRRGR